VRMATATETWSTADLELEILLCLQLLIERIDEIRDEALAKVAEMEQLRARLRPQ